MFETVPLRLDKLFVLNVCNREEEKDKPDKTKPKYSLCYSVYRDRYEKSQSLGPKSVALCYVGADPPPCCEKYRGQKRETDEAIVKVQF